LREGEGTNRRRSRSISLQTINSLEYDQDPRVLELLAQGYTNQREIAQMLSVSEPTVSREVAHITRESKENLDHFVAKQIPLEIERCHMALNLVLRKAFEITNFILSKCCTDSTHSTGASHRC
jgi:transcription termination factor NusB